MSQGEGSPIQVDTDWKAQAQAEKERLAEQLQALGQAAGGQAEGMPGMSGEMPPATFETLVSTLATQALFALGAIAEPGTNKTIYEPAAARHTIDLLGVLQEKTAGNLSEDEATMIASVLYELRNRYVSSASNRGQQQPGGPTPPPGMGGMQ